MDRESLLELWDDAWTVGSWFGCWTAALDGLSPGDANWSPRPGVHSIWQIVNHVAFWREETLRIFAGQPLTPAEERERMNFPVPERADADAWQATRERLAASQLQLRAAIALPATPLERPRMHVVHDASHLGQVLYVRSLLGKSPLVS
jgi:hypothetical protein